MSEKDKGTESPETGIEESNPNAAGPEGLEGGMGVSSERTEPLPGPTIEGTGTVGSAAGRTDGSVDTGRGNGTEEDDDQDSEPPDTPAEHPDMPAEGPEMDQGQNDAQDEWRDSQPAATGKKKDRGKDKLSIDRTVGESNTADVPSHEFDPAKSQRHSHG